jgi:hypothetical protein
MDGTLERVENVTAACRNYLEALIVIIPAYFAFCHNISLVRCGHHRPEENHRFTRAYLP